VRSFSSSAIPFRDAAAGGAALRRGCARTSTSSRTRRGHLILKSIIGNPTASKKTLEYRAHEEGAADLVALIACLHFDHVVGRLLANTRGRLFSRNMLSRFGEASRGAQIRSAFNSATIWSPSVATAEAKYDTHAFSKLFTGVRRPRLRAVPGAPRVPAGLAGE
jgi:hypothetical protein